VLTEDAFKWSTVEWHVLFVLVSTLIHCFFFLSMIRAVKKEIVYVSGQVMSKN